MQLALEGRRRVKEQLKKMGSFRVLPDFIQLPGSSKPERRRFVGVPEQGGKGLISPDPLAPGTIYSASVSTDDGTVGMYRLEITTLDGDRQAEAPAGGISGIDEGVNQPCLQLPSGQQGCVRRSTREVDTSDFHVEVIDLLGNKVEAELGVAFFGAAYSILRNAPPQAGLLVLGDMSVQGNVKPVRSLTEPLQVAMDNGAKRALIPIENKRQFLEVNADVLEHVDPIFYGDLRQAAFKALGLN